MENKSGYEIERKFLIAMPDVDKLTKESVRRLEIEQTYLLSLPEESARVRKITENGVSSYVHTQKKKITAMKRLETERVICESEYISLLDKADLSRRAIHKVRYCLPYDGHVFEIDIFPFWTDKALLEIELKEEKETFSIPPQIDIIREVTADKRFTNASLAKELPII